MKYLLALIAAYLLNVSMGQTPSSLPNTPKIRPITNVLPLTNVLVPTTLVSPANQAQRHASTLNIPSLTYQLPPYARANCPTKHPKPLRNKGIVPFFRHLAGELCMTNWV